MSRYYDEVIFDDYEDDDDDYYAEMERKYNARMEAYYKNEELAYQLYVSRDDFCGIGTRKTKLFLNKLIKQGNQIAAALRKALECEDVNICAKKYGRSEWRDRNYNKKKVLINELIEICKANNYVYGIQDTDNYSTNYIVYFELPNCEQISFHNNFALEDVCDLPHYDKEWDGKRNSTLPKLEQAITKSFPEILELKQDKKKI